MNKFRGGFTLIELSIVLVIIGLLVAGVLVGRDLIMAAKIRKTMTELEQYKTAALTFKVKFGQVPGDIGPQKAAQAGLSFSNRAGTFGQGNEDGLIQGANVAAFLQYWAVFESKCFWADLTDTKLIAFNYNDVQATCDNSTGYVVGSASKYGLAPTSTIGFDTQWQIFSFGGMNYFTLVQYYQAGSQWRSVLPPIIAYSIDTKTDDGMPLTGITQATDPTNNPTFGGSNDLFTNAVAAAPAAGVCVSNASGSPYNNSVGTDTGACGLRFRASF